MAKPKPGRAAVLAELDAAWEAVLEARKGPPLADDEFTISSYAEATGLTPQTAGQRLRAMLERGMVECEKRKPPGAIRGAVMVYRVKRG